MKSRVILLLMLSISFFRAIYAMEAGEQLSLKEQSYDIAISADDAFKATVLASLRNYAEDLTGAYEKLIDDQDFIQHFRSVKSDEDLNKLICTTARKHGYYLGLLYKKNDKGQTTERIFTDIFSRVITKAADDLMFEFKVKQGVESTVVILSAVIAGAGLYKFVVKPVVSKLLYR